MSSKQHIAAVLPNKDTHHFVLEQRPTPTPGPDDILVEVHALAVNPIDFKQRNDGFPPVNYPAILGSDIGGIVVAVGSNVPSSYPQPGTRVTAFAPTFYTKGEPDTGAFQKYACLWKEMVTPIADQLSFTDAAMIGMAYYTSWNGIYTAGVPLKSRYNASDKKGLVIWGGGASVGMGMIQVARYLGFSTYVTASPKHHAYLKELGATRLFDYKDTDVVQQIVHAAKADGISLTKAYDAAGATRQCLDILKEFNGEEELVLASAVASIFAPNSPTEPGVAIKFVLASQDPVERREHMAYYGQEVLKEMLASGAYVPSGKKQIVPGGFESLDKALDILEAGVSGTKLVLEV